MPPRRHPRFAPLSGGRLAKQPVELCGVLRLDLRLTVVAGREHDFEPSAQLDHDFGENAVRTSSQTADTDERREAEHAQMGTHRVGDERHRLLAHVHVAGHTDTHGISTRSVELAHLKPHPIGFGTVRRLDRLRAEGARR